MGTDKTSAFGTQLRAVAPGQVEPDVPAGFGLEPGGEDGTLMGFHQRVKSWGVSYGYRLRGGIWAR